MGSMSRDPIAGLCGLAGDPLSVQRDRVLAAWSGFLAAVSAADLAGPSRLPGWTGHDVAVHIADWDSSTTLDRLVAQARSGSLAAPVDVDSANAAVVAAHRTASRASVLAALERSRRGVASWFATDGPALLGRVPVMSVVGPLPLLTVVNAGAYELAVHALDLGGVPDPSLLEAGLAALVDVTGVFAHRRGLDTSLTAWTGAGGWQVRTSSAGWTTAPVTARPPGAVVEGSAAVLLDASAGRRAVPPLLASRALRIHGLADILRLAPIVDEVPGLPGGAALRAAGRWAGTTGRLLRLAR
jgi:uncharacterized protein (TIGR03083 family)